MDMAIEQIVSAYVRLQNRQALEDLRAHRQRLLADLRGRSDRGYDLSATIHLLAAEIAAVESGLATLAAHSVASEVLSNSAEHKDEP